MNDEKNWRSKISLNCSFKVINVVLLMHIGDTVGVPYFFANYLQNIAYVQIQ